jgi:glycerol-3-phosphate dehydrogenase
MTALDPLAVRAFTSEVDNHRREAARALEQVIQSAQDSLASLYGDPRTASLRQVAQYAAEAVAHGNALHALNRVAGLIAEES